MDQFEVSAPIIVGIFKKRGAICVAMQFISICFWVLQAKLILFNQMGGISEKGAYRQDSA